MKEKGENTKLAIWKEGPETKKTLPGYPPYHAAEDIYSKYDEERDVDPEDVSKSKLPVENERGESRLNMGFNDDFADAT